jgi:hypothetical protein
MERAQSFVQLIALGLPVAASVKEISTWATPRAEEVPITIDGSDPSGYKIAA